jgi:hypothetical protein
MKMSVEIEILPEPEISFAAGKAGVDPRAMARHGAAGDDEVCPPVVAGHFMP